MNKKLWEPSKKIKKNSNLFKFEKFLSNRYKKKFDVNFEKIHNWSIKNPQNFWDSIWDYSKVKGKKKVFPYNAVGKAQADSFAKMSKGKISYNPTYGMEKKTKSGY